MRRPAAIRAARRVAAPVAAQGVTALTSLVLQVIAVRALGLAEFGAFALLLGLLVAASALYTGYVGDSLAVLDRHDPPVRGALVTSALLSIGLAAAVGFVAVLLAAPPGKEGLAVVYAGLTVAWLLRETLRRLLIARQEFGRLLVNDCVYLVLTLAGLGVLEFLALGMSLGVLLMAMCLGAVLAVLVGAIGLRGGELRRLRPGLRGMRELAAFASWRAAQAALRPLALLAARVLVGAFLGLAAVGLLEAARLLVAPLQVVVNGAGSYLLPGFAAAERDGRRRPDADRATLLLVGGTVAVGAVAAALAGPLGRLLTGAPLDPLLVGGWVVYLAVWAAGLAYVAEAVARKLSRPTFTVRLADSLAGLVLVVGVLAAGAGAVWVPWLMAVGGVYSVVRLRALAVRTR